jgi:hypothetical protein
MAEFHHSFRAALASLAILSGTALSIAFLSTTFTDSASAASKAVKKNFAAKCERVYSDKSVKALAIEETLSYQQICVCARTNRNLRRQLGAAGVTCINNQVTNINQAVSPTGEPGPGPGPEPGPTLNGNNGWGNGGEGINSGSPHGNADQSGTKSADAQGTGDR